MGVFVSEEIFFLGRGGVVSKSAFEFIFSALLDYAFGSLLLPFARGSCDASLVSVKKAMCLVWLQCPFTATCCSGIATI